MNRKFSNPYQPPPLPPRAPICIYNWYGPVPDNANQFNINVWSQPDGMYLADLDMPSICPVNVFHPRHLTESPGYVEVYIAMDPQTWTLGMNVAVGPMTRVNVRRTAWTAGYLEGVGGMMGQQEEVGERGGGMVFGGNDGGGGVDWAAFGGPSAYANSGQQRGCRGGGGFGGRGGYQR